MTTARRRRSLRCLEPGAVIGILGGGQLGRMTALAAARLGYRCHIFCPEPGSPATLVAAEATIARYDDRAALRKFAASVDVVTFEFENVPHESLAILARHAPVRPNARSLKVSQDRLREKRFLRSIGVPVAPFRAVRSARALKRALGDLGAPAILKTTRLGYDGKGQYVIRRHDEAAAIWQQFGAETGVLEARIDFACEISVVLARGLDRKIACYVPVENHHVDGILDTTVAPARVSKDVQRTAITLARRIASRLDLVGVLAVEMFVTRDRRVLVNELAPRPHNSGHWTIDACLTSQFEQQVRAVSGLPLGSTERHSNARMENLIGDDARAWRRYLDDPRAHLHLYGKTDIRPGRKMGHVTWLKPRR